jgi:glutathione S-transferase
MNNSSHDDGKDTAIHDCSNMNANEDNSEEILVSKPPAAKRTKLQSKSTTTTTASVYGCISSESEALMASIMMISNNNDDDADEADGDEAGGVLEPAAPAAAVFTFLHADFCPYANRVWIALLEKQQQHTQKLFNEVLCCYFAGPVKDEGTKLLYSLGFKTVPVAIYNNAGGESFQALGKSSSLLAEYVDDVFSSSNNSINDKVVFSSLKPTDDPMMLFNMRYFINKYESYCDYFYTYLMNQDQLKEKNISQKFQLNLKDIDNDLNLFKKGGGPYLCGNVFTLADIHIFGFIERTIIVIQHYKKYGNNSESSSSRSWKIDVGNNNEKEKEEETADDDNDFKNISRWYRTIIERPSIKNYIIVERIKQSKDIMIFEALERKEYLIEVYECYANNEVQLAKTIHAKHSRPGYNAYKKYRQEKML